SNPTFGIMGTAIAMSFSVVLVTILHLASLKKMIQFMIPLEDIVKMIFLVGLTWQIGLTLKNIFMKTSDNLMMFLLTLMLLTFIYIVCIILLRFITKDELKQIPLLQKWLYKYFYLTAI